ncbi:MAG: hypothetical protein GY765_17575 [bacterium]|nr:hypothetical protein [bacterium]
MNRKNGLLIIMILLFMLCQTPVFSVALTVTTTEDGVTGSLREAIAIAQADGSTQSVIYLPAGVYTLTTYDPYAEIQGGMEIDFPNSSTLYIVGEDAASTIIDCDGNGRAFKILGGEVRISDITIRNGIPRNDTGVFYGKSGGGIINQSRLVLTRCVISGCQSGIVFLSPNVGSEGGRGGGIYNAKDAELSMYRCIIDGNYTSPAHPFSGNQLNGGTGGGICNSGTLYIANSIISNNYTGEGLPSGHGGGIAHSEGQIEIHNSTISGNHTGNGLTDSPSADSGQGGGIVFYKGTGNISKSTLSGNYTGNGYTDDDDSAYGAAGFGGAVAIHEGSLTLESCTITSNYTGDGLVDPSSDDHTGDGGGLYSVSGSQLYLHSSILANNSVGQNGKGPDGMGGLSTNGNALIENVAEITVSGDSTGVITGEDPLLGPLADNGGFTMTHALQTGSPAIDAGGSVPFDQRYFSAPMDIENIANANNGSDLGAYEYNAVQKPYLAVNRNLLKFSADKSGNISAGKSFTIGTDHEIQVTNDADPNFLTITSSEGTGYSRVTVNVSAAALANMQPGTYVNRITCASPSGYSTLQEEHVIVVLTVHESTAAPFGSFDTPVNGSTVSSSIAVTGWAVDDIDIASIKIYRDPVSGEGSGRVFVGNAIQVENARPDLAGAYPSYPGSTKAGWGYMMLTNFLPNRGNGVFSLYAVVTDMEGNELSMGPKVITCDNANATTPFGAIDTPGQGETISGAGYTNFGWALTPPENTIPIDGSTISVYIDGEPVGSPVYNVYREDIAAFFPGYNNSSGAVGHFALDTTAYDNGVHTISWSVADDAGNQDGIGSRYFNIQNETGMAPKTTAAVPPKRTLRNVATDRSLLDIKTAEGEFEIAPDDKGFFHVEIKETERLVMRLEGHGAGYLDINGKQVKLPVGSRLDAGKGIFYWQPGPGFLGSYTLVFTGQSEKGKRKKTVIVTIAPRD